MDENAAFALEYILLRVRIYKDATPVQQRAPLNIFLTPDADGARRRLPNHFSFPEIQDWVAEYTGAHPLTALRLCEIAHPALAPRFGAFEEPMDWVVFLTSVQANSVSLPVDQKSGLRCVQFANDNEYGDSWTNEELLISTVGYGLEEEEFRSAKRRQPASSRNVSEQTGGSRGPRLAQRARQDLALATPWGKDLRQGGSTSGGNSSSRSVHFTEPEVETVWRPKGLAERMRASRPFTMGTPSPQPGTGSPSPRSATGSPSPRTATGTRSLRTASPATPAPERHSEVSTVMRSSRSQSYDGTQDPDADWEEDAGETSLNPAEELGSPGSDAGSEGQPPNDSEMRAAHAILDPLRSIEEGEDAEVWDRTRALFRCEPAARSARVPGIRTALRDYQLAAVWTLLTRPGMGIQSALLGLDMGLGKTLICLATAVVFHTIKSMWTEVCQSRRNKMGGTSPTANRHHPAQGVSDGTPCPLQRPGIQCPCVPGSDAHLIAVTMESLPAAVVCPPNLLGSWVKEWELHISTDRGSPAANMRLVVAHQAYRRVPRYFLPPAEWREGAGRWLWEQRDDGQPTEAYADCRRMGVAGATRFVLLGSSAATDQLRGDLVSVRYSGANQAFENTTSQKYELGLSMLFLDEVHKYRGSPAHKTKPFALLREVGETCRKATLAVGVSGSLIPGGPDFWDGLLRYGMEVAQSKGRAFPCHGLANEAELEQVRHDWDYLGRRLPNGPEAETQESRERMRTALGALFRNVAIYRRQEDEFRGRPLLPLPANQGRDRACTMEPGTGRDAVLRATEGVRDWMNLQYTAAVAKWHADGGRGAAVTERSVQDRVLNTANLAVPAAGTASTSEDFQRIRHSAVYPYVADLLERKQLLLEDLGTDKINGYARGFTNYSPIVGVRDGGMVAELAKSTFWAERKELADQSPKFGALTRRVDDMTASRGVDTDTDPGPLDKSGVRHMLVFTDTPASAYITAMLLWDRYATSHVQILLYHAGLPVDKIPSKPYRHKDGMIQNLQTDCKVGGPHKIMIGTYENLSTGHNLQRASYAVLMDEPSAQEYVRQAMRRVIRLGQRMTPYVDTLHDETNLWEAQRRRHNKTLIRTGEVAWIQEDGSVDWSHFGLPTQDEEGLSDE